ncbi:APC family permease [Spiroplasma culicicola]|uniref:Putative permease n=1 Tax=Spiroplasma culicicola AES-1 TaxID=1276246 RepID=W6A7W5_9MOLU|nr:APC family permease [Spiroplasma culicicola]AHI53203.1 putative permease [Spiroplasma culicicola AES-1]
MKTKSEQLSLFNIIWIGFCFIAGITFTASFAAILGNDGVGLHIYWIFAVIGVIAFMCAWSFGKLVQVHPEANGGGSQYTRVAFGKFWGLVMGLLNYAVIPVIGMALLVSMIRANFDGGEFNLVGYKDGEWGQWGSWGSLYLDLISYALYIFAITIIFLGLKKYKIFSTIIGYSTWGLTIILMIFGLVGGSMNLIDGNNGFEHQQGAQLGFDNFASTFTTCFFAFCGIETFITTGKNIKDRNKNMPIAIIVILILTTLFYIIFTAIIMMAVTVDFEGNPNMQIFDAFNNDFLKTFGPILVVVCTILMRFNSSLQITLFGGATLEPLASQKMLPGALNRENKDNIPVAGVLATGSLFTFTFILFILIPDLIQGFRGEPTPFNYGTLASCASIILISIYLLIIAVVMVQGMRKNIKVRVWEYIAWTLTTIFLIFILALWAKGVVEGFISKELTSIIAGAFQLFYLVLIACAAIGIYFGYHKKQMVKIQENKEELNKLQEYEKVFTIIK